MPKKQHEITSEYITLEIEGEWYCIPFIILEECPFFMQKAISHESTADFFESKENPYRHLKRLIMDNPVHFKIILISCKLY